MILLLFHGEMVDFGKSDKMMKINGKVDEPNMKNLLSVFGLSTFPLIFIVLISTKILCSQPFTSYFWCKKYCVL